MLKVFLSAMLKTLKVIRRLCISSWCIILHAAVRKRGRYTAAEQYTSNTAVDRKTSLSPHVYDKNTNKKKNEQNITQKTTIKERHGRETETNLMLLLR